MKEKLSKFDIRAKQFAKAYIRNKLNGTATALELYNTTSENTAGAIASENLRKPKIAEAIVSEMDKRGLTDEHLDIELNKVISQDKQLAPKVSAIQEANKLKSRYPRESQEHRHLHLQLPTKQLRDQRLKDLLMELEEIRGNRQVNTKDLSQAGAGGETPEGEAE